LAVAVKGVSSMSTAERRHKQPGSEITLEFRFEGELGQEVETGSQWYYPTQSLRGGPH